MASGEGGDQHNFDKFFNVAVDRLDLTHDQALVAKAFWRAFGSVALGSKNDAERNSKLSMDLDGLGASFSEITVKDIYNGNQVPFYTVKVFGEQLIDSQGNVSFNFQPSVDTPVLEEKYNLKYCTVQLGLPDLSQKIVEGAASMHQYFSQHTKRFRNDLLGPSETMNSHFIQAILSVADAKNA